jgi:hypothetical protein
MSHRSLASRLAAGRIRNWASFLAALQWDTSCSPCTALRQSLLTGQAWSKSLRCAPAALSLYIINNILPRCNSSFASFLCPLSVVLTGQCEFTRSFKISAPLGFGVCSFLQRSQQTSPSRLRTICMLTSHVLSPSGCVVHACFKPH